MSGYNCKKNIVFFCLFYLNSVDPDEMQHNIDPDEMQHHAAFHLGLNCLQKYSFRALPKYKGSMKISPYREE